SFLAAGKQLLELCSISGQRAHVTGRLATPGELFYRRAEQDSESTGPLQCCPIVRLNKGSSSQRDYDAVFQLSPQQFIQDGALNRSEIILRGFRKDGGDAALCASFNQLAQLVEPPPQPLGQDLAHCGLTRTHEADEKDTPLWLWFYMRSASLRAGLRQQGKERFQRILTRPKGPLGTNKFVP